MTSDLYNSYLNPLYLLGIKCGALDAPINGSVSITGAGIRAIATYTCKDMHVLLGQKRRRCQVNGEWSGSPPSCIIRLKGRGDI